MDPAGESPEDDARLARRALDEGDVGHAASHAAAAFGERPDRREYEVLVEQVAAASTDPVAEFSRDDWFGTVAARAVALRQRGDHAQALDLLLQVASYRVDLPFETVIVRWLREAPHETPTPFHAIARLAFEIAGTLTGRIRVRPGEARALERVATVLDAAVERPGAEASVPLQMAAASVYRRLGQCDRALVASARLQAAGASLDSALMEGLVHRSAGDFSRAVSAFQRAAALGDRVALAELARAHWDRHAYAEAARAIEAMGDLGDDVELKQALVYLRWKDGQSDQGGPIAAIVGGEATPDDARSLGEPWEGYLPEPREASTNALRQIMQQREGNPAKLAVTLSCMESPSARLAFVLATTGGTHPAAGDYRFESLPSPDPREPRHRDGTRLWTFGGRDGHTPEQRLPPPPESIYTAIDALASRPYFLPAWWSRAAEVAAQVQAPPDRWLAALVHPSEPPPDIPAWEWVQRRQHAATYVLARLDSGWTGSRRREALLGLLRGQPDWPIEAAIVAAGEILRDEPEACEELVGELWSLTEAIPDQGHLAWADALAVVLARLPMTPENLRQWAHQWFEHNRSGGVAS